jgi:hypothetical protein
MISVFLVVLIFASPHADVPETVVRVPLPGATIAQCAALASQVDAMTSTPGKPYRTECEYPEAAGQAI